MTSTSFRETPGKRRLSVNDSVSVLMALLHGWLASKIDNKPTVSKYTTHQYPKMLHHYKATDILAGEVNELSYIF